MASEYVKIEGVDRLVRLFDNLPERVAKRAITPALREAGKLIKEQAVQNLSGHVRTGLLQRSIKVETLRQKPGYPVMVIVGITRRSNIMDELMARYARRKHRKLKDQYRPFYWIFLEHGTKRIPKHAWLRPALDSSIPKIESMLQAYINSYFNEDWRD